MPVVRPRTFFTAVALIALAALAAAPALATEVDDRNRTAETPSDAVEAGESEIAGKWFWGGWWGAYPSYYSYWCGIGTSACVSWGSEGGWRALSETTFFFPRFSRLPSRSPV